MTPIRAAALCLPLAAALAPRAAAAEPEKKPGIFVYWNNDLAAVVKTQEAKLPRIDKLLGLLRLKTGMTILDIGAGTGQQSYKMAAALAGTGRVYSTDIDPQLVAYMTQQARARGLRNMEPVLVAADGVDPFYASRKFDLVLVYDLVSYLHDRVDYFSRIRESLAPGGRVVVIGQPEATHYPFEREDFADWSGFMADLRSEPPDTVYGRALAEPVREMLKTVTPGDVEGTARAVLFQLNRNLEGDLFAGFDRDGEVDERLALTPDERAYATWLTRRLRLACIPGKRNHAEILYIEIRDIVTLNKLVLIQRYRKYLKSDGSHPYLPRGPEERWLGAHNAIPEEFARAGYRADARVELVPFQNVWIFSAAAGPAPAGAK